MADTMDGSRSGSWRSTRQGEPPTRPRSTPSWTRSSAGGITDLFIFSHGWNNDRDTAERLYRGFFGQLRKVVDDPALPKRRQARIGTAGVFWPSILWPDEQPEAAGGRRGGARRQPAVCPAERRAPGRRAAGRPGLVLKRLPRALYRNTEPAPSRSTPVAGGRWARGRR